MRRIFLILFVTFFISGCIKKDNLPSVTVHGCWKDFSFGYLSYTDSVESVQGGYYFDDPTIYIFENWKIYYQNQIVGIYTPTTVKYFCDTVTYTITFLDESQMSLKEYPNGLANGIGRVRGFKR